MLRRARRPPASGGQATVLGLTCPRLGRDPALVGYCPGGISFYDSVDRRGGARLPVRFQGRQARRCVAVRAARLPHRCCAKVRDYSRGMRREARRGPGAPARPEWRSGTSVGGLDPHADALPILETCARGADGVSVPCPVEVEACATRCDHPRWRSWPPRRPELLAAGAVVTLRCVARATRGPAGLEDVRSSQSVIGMLPATSRSSCAPSRRQLETDHEPAS